MTRVLMVVLVPKPRMLKGWPVGCSWPVGMVKVHTPGILFMIWSTPVSGIDWTCWRFSTVVLTSSFSTSVPRPALTVTGVKVVMGGAGGVEGGVEGGVSWALASAGIRARPANAARVATRTEDMKATPRRTNKRDAPARGIAASVVRRGGVD